MLDRCACPEKEHSWKAEHNCLPFARALANSYLPQHPEELFCRMSPLTRWSQQYHTVTAFMR